jgi:hypothetical protein
MNNELVETSSDIIRLFNVAKSVGWVSLRENSIYRIMYMASVIYGFRYPDSIFQGSYNFSVQMSGPHSKQIKDAITYLETNDILEHIEDNYSELVLVQSNTPDVSIDMNDDKKTSWFKSIMYIIGVYGESKIYEFIIRDPEYRNSVLSNAPRVIDLGSSNKTVATLNDLKGGFEKNDKQRLSKLSDERYLELYFEYVFSRILTGDISF